MIQHAAVSRRESVVADTEPYSSPSTVVAALDPSYERLTPRNAALLLIDHQVGPLWELDFAETRRVVATLARVSHEMRLPTVITAIGPEVWGDVIPELSAVVGEAPPIVRTEINPWGNATIRHAIERTRRKKLIMAGGAAPVALALCAISAARAGFDVYTPLDASAQFGHATITRLSRDGIIITATRLLLAELTHRDASPPRHNRRY